MELCETDGIYINVDGFVKMMVPCDSRYEFVVQEPGTLFFLYHYDCVCKQLLSNYPIYLDQQKNYPEPLALSKKA